MHWHYHDIQKPQFRQSAWTRNSGYQDQYQSAKLSQGSNLILVWCTHQDDLELELEGVWSSLELWEDSEVASESESVVVGQGSFSLSLKKKGTC